MYFVSKIHLTYVVVNKVVQKICSRGKFDGTVCQKNHETEGGCRSDSGTLFQIYYKEIAFKNSMLKFYRQRKEMLQAGLV